MLRCFTKWFWKIHGMAYHPAGLLMTSRHHYAACTLPDPTLLWTNSKNTHYPTHTHIVRQTGPSNCHFPSGAVGSILKIMLPLKTRQNKIFTPTRSCLSLHILFSLQIRIYENISIIHACNHRGIHLTCVWCREKHTLGDS